MESFERFSLHIKEDRPEGVFLGTQWTGTCEKIEELKKRYPDGKLTQGISDLKIQFSKELYLMSESCFIIDPEIYLSWLRKETEKRLTVKRIKDHALDLIQTNGKFSVLTQKGETHNSDKLFTGMGNYHRLWKKSFPEDSLIQTSQAVQGSYLVYDNILFGNEYFSLTLNGDNLIYHPHTQKLIIGSTTVKSEHLLPDLKELKRIDSNLRGLLLSLKWPSFEEGHIITGLREKAKQRRPFLEKRNGLILSGGYYKNGYSLGLYLAERVLKIDHRDSF